MGAIARNIANKITTSGVFTSGAITNSSVTGITVLANASDGITLISSQTASNSASLSFTSGLDSTYKAYKFVFSSIKPRGSNVFFSFQGDTSTNTNYNQTITSTTFYSYNAESDGGAVQYVAGSTDQEQGTAFQYLNYGTLANDADTSLSGTLQLFNPASTTYVKHFISNTNSMLGGPYSSNGFGAGYFNTTSAITRIQFKMSSGNFDGTIYLYGIK